MLSSFKTKQTNVYSGVIVNVKCKCNFKKQKLARKSAVLPSVPAVYTFWGVKKEKEKKRKDRKMGHQSAMAQEHHRVLIQAWSFIFKVLQNPVEQLRMEYYKLLPFEEIVQI